ncbi:peptide chain release factor N(5)-glutamine methyltransferase [Devosia sp.]|uniref:peptide chain release factor N(5)-glutamine methyltransferase n=1 Tax=Devosia sp. TaxID=1871048 RepID=UPI003BA9A923
MGAAWRSLRDLFRQAGLDTPELDARLLAELAFGMEGLALVTREREPASPDAVKRLEALGKRRLAGEPVARILGEKEFWGLPFKLHPATLVPRPETEALVQRGLDEIGPLDDPRILDLGTGTGCIPIAILTELFKGRAVATDLSHDALATARANAELHGVADRFSTRQGSWFDPIEPGERFDLITSNPPYIDSSDIAGLSIEVREHDPHLALDGGPDGLRAYRAIASEAGQFLKPEGLLLLEIGAAQAAAVSDILVGAGLADIVVERDLSGHNRVIAARRAT